ncbi:MAG: hypothetical protein WKF35_04805 [Ferruginibacter sp.]
MRKFLLLLTTTAFLGSSCSNSPKTNDKTIDEQSAISINEPNASKEGLIKGVFGGCGYNYTPTQNSITVYQPGQRELNQISSILSFSGLASNFKVYSAPIENAIATIINNKRYILYDPRLLSFSDKQSGNYWSSMSILAHEIGHHLSGHTLTNKGSNPHDELEADKFSGFILYKLGASLTQAVAAMQTLGSENDSYSHPSKFKRIQEITKGWNEASQQRYESAVPPPPTDEQNGKPFWRQDEFAKEELICPAALSDPTYGGVINKYNHPVLEGIILDVTKEDPSGGGKAEFCNESKSEFNMVVTIQFTNVSPSPFPEIKRKTGQREKFHLTEYYQMSHAGVSAFEAIMVAGRKIRFRSFYFGYEAEDIFFLKKLNRNGESSSPNTTTISNTPRVSNIFNVTTSKAYFYTQPDINYQKRAYLVYGESFQSSTTQNGFIFVDFINQNGKRTTGWIKLTDVSQ